MVVTDKEVSLVNVPHFSSSIFEVVSRLMAVCFFDNELCVFVEHTIPDRTSVGNMM